MNSTSTNVAFGVGSREQRLAAFAVLERESGLFDRRFDGWSPWRVMRHPVYLAVAGFPLAQPSRRNFRRVASALRSTLRLAWLLVGGGRRRLLVKTCRSALRLTVGDRFRDVYFDGLIAAGNSAFKLEEINSPHFERQAATALHPSDLEPAVFTFWGRVLGAIAPAKVDDFCAATSRLLDERLGVDLPARWLRMRVSTVYWQARLYALLLARIRPAAVLVADTGEYALCLASRRRGITFLELQHGVFDAAHPDAVPDYVSGTEAELLLPDVLACHGDYWRERLRSTRQFVHSASVGNETIDLARERRANRSPSETRSILLTTQGLDSERMALWIEQLIATAPAGLDWRLTIKLHPVYDERTVIYDRLLANSRVRIVKGSEQPNVYDLLTESDLHLSVSSSCHFDAVALGLTSLVVPLGGYELMREAMEEGLLKLARAPAEVWTELRQPKPNAGHAVRVARPGFVANMQQVLALSRER